MWDYHDFVQLRNLIVGRLTLYNARRGGEPARLTLSEWTEAEEGHWVDPQLAEKVTDPLDQALLEGTKLAYQAGKGSRKLVPVLIPNDTVEAVRKLVSERKNAGIHANNVFLFPNTCHSTDHVSGYNCVKSVTVAMGEQLTKPNLLIADKFRHRASTLFALLDLPENERESWYRHMGHSADINKDVYQCPLAVTEITKVGGFLSKLDCQGKKAVSNKPASTASSQQPAVSPSPHDEPPFSASDTPALQVGPSVSPLAASRQQEASSPEPEEDERSRQPSSSTVPQASATVSASAPSPKKRSYRQWNEADTETVCTYFDKYVKAKGTGSKGPLPGTKDIKAFLGKFQIFEHLDLPEKEKIALVKTKVFNARKKYRNHVHSMFESC